MNDTKETEVQSHIDEAWGESQWFFQAVLDALPAHIAILDDSGTVLFGNAAWRRFADGNGFGRANYGVGLNYLERCDTASGDERGPHGYRWRRLAPPPHHHRDEFFLEEYPCHSQREQRWFRVRVTHFPSAEGCG